MKKKNMALFLAAALIFGAAPVSGAALTEELQEPGTGDGRTQEFIFGQGDLTYQDAVSEAQGFRTKCRSEYAVQQTDDGLFIFPGEAGRLPQLTVYRYYDVTMDETTHLTEVITPVMKELYAASLVSISEVNWFSIGGKTAPGILYELQDANGEVHCVRINVREGKDIINYTAYFLTEDALLMAETMETAIENFAFAENDASGRVPGGSTEAGGNDEKPSEASQVVYETYTEPWGYFTMEIPRGWKVEIGIKPQGTYSLVSYAITVSDPANPDRMLYYNLFAAGMAKTQEGHDWYATYYGPASPYAQTPVATEVSTKGVFEGCNHWFDYSDFTLVQNLGPSIPGGELLLAECTSTLTGRRLEGLFTVGVMENVNYVQKYPEIFGSTEMLDVGDLMTTDLLMMTAPKEEFEDWEPVLEHCLSSLQFTEDFDESRAAEWRVYVNNASYIAAHSQAISDMIRDTWEYRDRTYDESTRKYSDTVLGG